MHKMIRRALFAASAVTLAASSAQAQHQMGAVPTNATIVFAGLRWAWAHPLPASSGMVTANQFNNFGWRFPTVQELNNAPNATDFMFRGANVPYLGTDPVSGATFAATNSALVTDAACATPWFSNSFKHCDWQDGNGQVYGPWAGTASGSQSFAEQLVVQGATNVVPEPSTYALFGAGLLGLGAAARRRRRTA